MKKETINLHAEEFAKQHDETVEVFNVLFIVKFCKDGNYNLKIWKRRQTHPFINYSFTTQEKRELCLHNMKEKYEKAFQAKEEYQQKRNQRQIEFQKKLKIGDILVSSWGYNQTNVDFYQIVNKKNTIVTIRKIAADKNTSKGDHMSGTAMPCKNKFIDNPIRKKIGDGFIRLEYSQATLWNGNPQEYSSCH